MKRSVKQLSGMTNFNIFYNIVVVVLKSNCVKNLIVVKIVKNIKVDGNWCELEAKNCLQRKSRKKFIRQL